MSKPTPLISIVIVNYNTAQETKDCLESLSKIKVKNFDYNIVIVDNGSKVELKLPQKLINKHTELIRTEANIGFTGGNNLGIAHAVKSYNSDYFLLLNSDTTVKPNFLIKLFTCLQEDNQAGIASSKIYFYPGNEFHKNYAKKHEGKVLWYAGGSIDWLNLAAFHRGVDEVDRGQFDQQLTSDFATGCSMLLRREVIEDVGILDKKYFLYLEDVDFSVRTKNLGYKLLFCPESIVWHKNAGSSEGAGSQIQQYYQTRNRLLFFIKYGSLKTKLTGLRLMFNFLTKGNTVERKAVYDYLMGQFGKQPVI
ncbi:MAG: glycosyltransferase family 2 protein [Patescibacteria group bacterium]|nr:glycosyltransferase family 2 protein [Patescibacteria group bacterium]